MHQLFKDQLMRLGIRPSYQRIRILEYLHQEGGHPTAEEIYAILVNEIPALSKTTVYNTLHIFAEAGLVRIIKIDQAEARFDATVKNHGHFQCSNCGAIFNFPIDIESIQIPELSQFKIKEKNIYYSGLCPQCQNLT